MEQGGHVLLERDEGIRSDSTPDALAALSPAFEPDGIVTAGSSSQLSDGSAALVLASERACTELGLTPLAWVRSTVTVGMDPDLMMEGPIVATTALLKRHGAGFRRHRPVRIARGVRASDSGLVHRTSGRPDAGSMWMVAPSASGIRSAPREPVRWRTCRTGWVGTVDGRFRPCAVAAASEPEPSWKPRAEGPPTDAGPSRPAIRSLHSPSQPPRSTL